MDYIASNNQMFCEICNTKINSTVQRFIGMDDRLCFACKQQKEWEKTIGTCGCLLFVIIFMLWCAIIEPLDL